MTAPGRLAGGFGDLVTVDAPTAMAFAANFIDEVTKKGPGHPDQLL
jgi:hypothetical protein